MFRNQQPGQAMTKFKIFRLLQYFGVLSPFQGGEYLV